MPGPPPRPVPPHGAQRHLTGLRLGRATTLSPRGWRWVGALRTLRSLDLQETPLRDSALSCWSGLSALTRLSLRGCGSVGDAGLAVLACFPLLAVADLAMCWRLGDATLGVLGCLGQLRSLDLTGCQRFGAEGLRALCEPG